MQATVKLSGLRVVSSPGGVWRRRSPRADRCTPRAPSRESRSGEAEGPPMGDRRLALREGRQRRPSLPLRDGGVRSGIARQLPLLCRAGAYTDVVNQRLKEMLVAGGYEVLSLEAFHILEFGGPSRMSETDIIDLSGKSVANAPGADGVVISCGGLRTLGVHKPLEQRTACRSSLRRRPRSGRRCGSSAKAATSPATAGCWSGRPPLCIRGDCAWTSARPHAF